MRRPHPTQHRRLLHPSPRRTSLAPPPPPPALAPSPPRAAAAGRRAPPRLSPRCQPTRLRPSLGASAGLLQPGCRHRRVASPASRPAVTAAPLLSLPATPPPLRPGLGPSAVPLDRRRRRRAPSSLRRADRHHPKPPPPPAPLHWPVPGPAPAAPPASAASRSYRATDTRPYSTANSIPYSAGGLQPLQRRRPTRHGCSGSRHRLRFFKESSDEEREHVEKLMEYQNRRGGRVRLQSIVTPLTEFDHPEKGDAFYAMELALALEKLVNEKLHNMHSVVEDSVDHNCQ